MSQARQGGFSLQLPAHRIYGKKKNNILPFPIGKCEIKSKQVTMIKPNKRSRKARNTSLDLNTKKLFSVYYRILTLKPLHHRSFPENNATFTIKLYRTISGTSQYLNVFTFSVPKYFFEENAEYSTTFLLLTFSLYCATNRCKKLFHLTQNSIN